VTRLAYVVVQETQHSGPPAVHPCCVPVFQARYVHPRRAITCADGEDHTPKQVKYPSPAVVGDRLLVCNLRIVSKVLLKPGDRYSRGLGSRHHLRKPSAEEGLHMTPPTVRPALASDWTTSDTETKKLLGVLQCHCHHKEGGNYEFPASTYRKMQRTYGELPR
jgi:hypothetical protein